MSIPSPYQGGILRGEVNERLEKQWGRLVAQLQFLVRGARLSKQCGRSQRQFRRISCTCIKGNKQSEQNWLHAAQRIFFVPINCICKICIERAKFGVCVKSRNLRFFNQLNSNFSLSLYSMSKTSVSSKLLFTIFFSILPCPSPFCFMMDWISDRISELRLYLISGQILIFVVI